MHRLTLHPADLAAYATTTDFLTAYRAAHTTHLADLTATTTALNTLALSTTTAAQAYTTSDRTTAATIRSTTSPTGEEQLP